MVYFEQGGFSMQTKTKKSKKAVDTSLLDERFGKDFVDLYIKINNRKISSAYQFRKIHSTIYDCDEYVWQGELPEGAVIKFVHGDGRILPNPLVYNQISGPGVTFNGGQACLDLTYSKALVCPVEGVELIYNFVDEESRLRYVSKTAVKTMFIRIYDNNSGVDNDRWLTIALE